VHLANCLALAAVLFTTLIENLYLILLRQHVNMRYKVFVCSRASES